MFFSAKPIPELHPGSEDAGCLWACSATLALRHVGSLPGRQLTIFECQLGGETGRLFRIARSLSFVVAPRNTATNRSPCQSSTSCSSCICSARRLAACSSMQSSFATQITCRLLSTTNALYRIPQSDPNGTVIVIECPSKAAGKLSVGGRNLCTCGNSAILEIHRSRSGARTCLGYCATSLA